MNIRHCILTVALIPGTMLTVMAQKQDKVNVFVLDAGKLASVRTEIERKNTAYMPAYKNLLKAADAALKFGPVSVMDKTNVPPSGDKHDYMSLAPYHWPDPSKADGLPYIRKDGQTNPEVKEYKDKEYMPELCNEVYHLALAWYFSGENVYARHAARLLRVWFLDPATKMNPNLNFAQAIKGVNTGRGAGLIDTRHFVKLIDAIGILRTSKEWSSTDQKGMEQWFAAFLEWMETSRIGKDEMAAKNNHGIWYDAQRLSMALFSGNKAAANEIVLSARSRLDSQMDENGSFPKEMVRTISLHYTVFALDAFFTVAAMAEKTDHDLWNYQSPSGKSLKKAFEVVYPYITKKKEWHGEQIKPFKFEDAYQVLYRAGEKYNCNECRNDIKSLAGDKYQRLLTNLIY